MFLHQYKNWTDFKWDNSKLLPLLANVRHLQVRSSIARRLGLEVSGMIDSPRNVDGVVEMMLDATQNDMNPLTIKRLFGWHAALFPSGYSGMYKID
jgi:hypothetical protein